jgi:phospholipid-binding lipoprotein MlaA
LRRAGPTCQALGIHKTDGTLISLPRRRIGIVAIVGILFLTMMVGCAGTIPPAAREDRAPADPWEPLNRRISNFNNGLDKVTMKPIAKGYQALLPDPMQQGITNFSNNLLGPLFIINNLLQGKFKKSLSETGRFLANSTWGILGFANVGADLGMTTYREDFGQTLATWGVPDGPYVVVPFLGPRTLRGAVTIPLFFYVDPLSLIEDDATRWAIWGVRFIDLRARLFTIDALVENSFDRYLTIRESYLQNRRFLILDGEESEEDDDFYDDFADDFEEDYEEESEPR